MESKSFILFLIVCSILLFSCNEEIISPTEEEKLTSILIGKWKSNIDDVITFNSDGSFIDTAYGIYDNNYEARHVLEGQYTIKDSIIFFSEVLLKYCISSKSPTITWFSTEIYPKIISFNHEEFKLTPVRILEPLNDSTFHPSREWKSINWLGSYETSSQPKYSGGQIRDIYYFNSDTLSCGFYREYLYETNTQTAHYETDCNYNGSFINFGKYTIFDVKITDSKMYLYDYYINYHKM